MMVVLARGDFGTAHFNGMHEARCYDAAGRLLGLTTSRTALADGCAPTEYVSRQQYTYDEEGNRLTQQEEVTQAGGVDVGAVETTESGYDEASRLVGVKYADGKAALYQLDGADSIGLPDGEPRGADERRPPSRPSYGARHSADNRLVRSRWDAWDR